MPDVHPFHELVWSLGTPCDPDGFPPLSVMEMLWATGKQTVAKAVAQTYPRRPGADRSGADPDELTGEGALGSGGHLYACIFAEPECNAVAAGTADCMAIGIYHGLAMVIPELVVWIYGNAAFLPNLGDVKRLPPMPAHPIPWGLQMLYSISRGTLGQDIDSKVLAGNKRALDDLHRATDPIRHAAAAYTIASAFRFIWLHEAAHVLLGHVDALRLNFGMASHSEAVNADSDEQVPPAVSQVLEIQADTLALDVLIGEEMDRLRSAVAKGVADQPIPEGQPQTPLTPRQAAGSVVLGCMLVPLVLHGQHHFQGKDEHVRTHPPLWFRAELTLQRAREIWGEDGDAAGLAAGLRDALNDLGQLHPLMAGWFGQLDGPSHAARCQQYIASLGNAFEATGGIRLHHKSHPSRHPH